MVLKLTNRCLVHSFPALLFIRYSFSSSITDMTITDQLNTRRYTIQLI